MQAQESNRCLSVAPNGVQLHCKRMNAPPVSSGEDLLSLDSERSGHAYPHELALLVRAHWSKVIDGLGSAQPSTLQAPELFGLERLLSVCYQASLLREEGRPITFRLALSEPEAFAASAGPPTGLHRLVFTRYRPLDEHELRRLAPAATFHRSLIGAQFDPQQGLQIWGLVHSGPRWLQSVQGAPDTNQGIPPVLVVAVMGPGRILVSKGVHTLGELSAGTLGGLSMDIFQAPWLAQIFADSGNAQWAAYMAKRQESTASALLDPTFGQLLAQQTLRRIVAAIRSTRHGGALILVPPHGAEGLFNDTNIALKYEFYDEEPRRRIPTLTARIMDELTSQYGAPVADLPVGWTQYRASSHPALAALDEALQEVAHLIASLTGVDGAVVMTNWLELLGFGGQILGTLPEDVSVARALDLEGHQREWVRTDRVGARHRSAYRFCQSMRDSVAVVVSQDGGVRFVRWLDDGVTYWDQMATEPWEV